MKYIVITAAERKGDGKILFPFIFPNSMVHDHVSRVMCLLLSLLHPRHDVTCTSAGEFSSMDINPQCHGKSESIGVSSKPNEDKTLINFNDYGAGMMG